MTRRHDVICISSIDWDFIWQGHQEIMSRLTASGHRVLYIENTGVRPARVSDLGRIRARLENFFKGTKGFREERPNLFVFSPLVLPWPYSRLAGWINRKLLTRSLQRWMRATGFARPIAWTFLPTPLARAVIEAVDPALTIYHCVDDFSASSAEARRIVTSEERMFQDADLVFVTSEKLRQRASLHSKRVHLFPSGVNLEAFRTTNTPTPDDLRVLPRPIAGYVGGLHQWVDQQLLAAVATRMPHMTFALIGPAQVDVSRLQQLPNVKLLGQRTHAELPAYIRGFDVGLVPYRIADYTANVYPAKMNEYLAGGKPVVSTDLPEVRRFNAEFHDLIRIGADADAFADAIATAVTEQDGDIAARRITAAGANSWEGRISAMLALIDEALTVKETSATGWEERFRRLYSLARRRTAQGLLTVVLAYVLLFQTPLVWWLAEPLRLQSPPQAADAIVVFAGGVGESGRAGGGLQERVTAAIDLYRGGYARHIVFSSGYVFTLREAEVMRAVAMDNGVPADAIVLEERARNTLENVTLSSQILRDRGWRRVLLVSSPYHMRRAMLTWRTQSKDIEAIPVPVPHSDFYTHTWGPSFDQIRGIAHEYAALADYWRRGWIVLRE